MSRKIAVFVLGVSVVVAGLILPAEVLAQGAGDLSLTIEGVGCPGNHAIMIFGATPGGTVALAGSPNAGLSSIPQGNCAGTELELENPNLLTVLTADDAGAVFLQRLVTSNQCGWSLQAVDLSNCATSDRLLIPSNAGGGGQR